MVWRVSCVCVISFIQIINMKEKKTSSRGEELSVRYNVTVCFCVSFFLWCRISEEHGASVWTRCLVFLETQISFFYRLYFLFRRKPPLPPPPPHPLLSDRMCECVRNNVKVINHHVKELCLKRKQQNVTKTPPEYQGWRETPRHFTALLTTCRYSCCWLMKTVNVSETLSQIQLTHWYAKMLNIPVLSAAAAAVHRRPAASCQFKLTHSHADDKLTAWV